MVSREKGKFLDSDRSREKRALFQDGPRPRRTCQVEFVERSPRRQVVGSNPAGPKFCFASEHRLLSVRPTELYSAERRNLQRTACPLEAQTWRPLFRHALALRFFFARGSVRTSCSALELSACRTSGNPRFLTPSPERTRPQRKIIRFARSIQTSAW